MKNKAYLSIKGYEGELLTKGWDIGRLGDGEGNGLAIILNNEKVFAQADVLEVGGDIKSIFIYERVYGKNGSPLHAKTKHCDISQVGEQIREFAFETVDEVYAKSIE